MFIVDIGTSGSMQIYGKACHPASRTGWDMAGGARRL